MRRRTPWWLAACLGCCALVPVLARGEDRSALEDSLFADGGGTTASAASAPPAMILTPEPKSVGFSGEITSAVVDLVSNTVNANYLYTYTVADIYLDARLPRQAKVFADVEATYLSQGQTTSVALQELFLDFNLAQTAYFRAGKQTLQWGRCYLWNPTDLINVERPHFVRKIGTREGAYGLKLHVPFGTVVNIYDFLDTGAASEAGAVANALKLEALLGNFEVAVSGWGKKGHRPVWGLDFSTRLFGVDTLGEVAASQGSNQTRAQVVDGELVTAADDEVWYPRASLDFSRSFTVGDWKDRLTVMAEGYYNQAGYDRNVLADGTVYTFAPPAGAGPAAVAHGTQKEFIFLKQLFQPNYFSRGYVALFTTFNRFLLADAVLNLNWIQNLVDNSNIVSLGVTYTELNGFTLGLLANGYLGTPNSEYTAAGEKYDLQMTFGIAF
jgi:hypothetical protein